MEQKIFKSLSEMKTDELGVISEIRNTGEMRKRLMDMGFIPGSTVRCVGKSPLGDPTAYVVKRAVIALRSEDSDKIFYTSPL